MAKAKAKQRKERRPTDKLYCLYRAVQEYVESQVGSVVVAGPVSLMQWPEDRPLKWTLAIACTGRPPNSGRAEHENLKCPACGEIGCGPGCSGGMSSTRSGEVKP